MRRLAVIVLAATLAQPAEAAAPGLAAATTLAKTTVVARFHVGGLYSVRAGRSKRNVSFALVTGYYRRPATTGPKLWAVWLRTRGSAWKVVYAGVRQRALSPKIDVPCDIWPAFSEPSC